jgi:hypothetical protein
MKSTVLFRRYRYRGDRLTDPELVGRECRAVLRADGKCIISVKFATMLVTFAGETAPRVVLRRCLRKL